MRYRYRRPNRTRDRAVALGLGAAVLAGAGHVTNAAPVIAHLTRAVHLPGTSAYTPASWARALLGALGDRQTSCNRHAIVAWESAEGGHWANSAQYNPLDTTMPEPGSWSMNSVGVQAYPSWRSGFRATIATLNNGRYTAILSALSAGSDAQAVANAVASSPWGTGAFRAEC